MIDPNKPKIGGFQLTDFVQAGSRHAAKTVADQKSLYLNQDGPAWFYYGPLYVGLRAAVNATDPQATLDRVVKQAEAVDLSKGLAYAEATRGFMKLRPSKATGVPVKPASWSEGDLTVDMRNMLGLRQPKGELLYVAAYAKKPTLTPDAADTLLYLMETVVDQALPGAIPVVWDLQRGKQFKLASNTNRAGLEGYVRGQAAAYLVAWKHAA